MLLNESMKGLFLNRAGGKLYAPPRIIKEISHIAISGIIIEIVIDTISTKNTPYKRFFLYDFSNKFSCLPFLGLCLSVSSSAKSLTP